VKGDQCMVRRLLLDGFWEGGRDETRDNDVAKHFRDQGGSWNALGS
jgi:hypothetical protein